MKVLVVGSAVIGTAAARPSWGREPEIDIDGLAMARYRSGFGGYRCRADSRGTPVMQEDHGANDPQLSIL